MDKFNALEHVTAWTAQEFGPATNMEEFEESLRFIEVVMGFMRDNPESNKSYREISEICEETADCHRYSKRYRSYTTRDA